MNCASGTRSRIGEERSERHPLEGYLVNVLNEGIPAAN
jgi:hypothetical protein